MDTQKAVALNNAIARTGHLRSDYRTEEAKQKTRWMLDYIFPSDLLVDLGCATGKQTFQAEALGARAVGLDCALDALTVAKTIAIEVSRPVDLIRENWESFTKRRLYIQRWKSSPLSRDIHERISFHS